MANDSKTILEQNINQILKATIASAADEKNLYVVPWRSVLIPRPLWKQKPNCVLLLSRTEEVGTSHPTFQRQ